MAHSRRSSDKSRRMAVASTGQPDADAACRLRRDTQQRSLSDRNAMGTVARRR